MPRTPPPNSDLADLVALLGKPNVCLLIETFLREYPRLVGQLAAADRATRHRLVHSLKSNARVVGARALSAQMAEFEQRLANPSAPELDAMDLAVIRIGFDQVAGPLRAFADGE
jgi:HPt (histidine-containing phosphotransfer) domain-containing protein